jgi:hypothetical protein
MLISGLVFGFLLLAPVVICDNFTFDSTRPKVTAPQSASLTLSDVALSTFLPPLPVSGSVTASGLRIGPPSDCAFDDDHTVQITPTLKGRLGWLTIEGVRRLSLDGQFFTGRYTLKNPCHPEPWFSRPQALDSIPTLRYQWDEERGQWVEDRFETVFVRMDHPDTLVFIAEPPVQGQTFMYRVFEPACIEFY